MLTRLGSVAKGWARSNPWTNVYGVARSLLGLGTLLTLATNRTAVLFRPASGLHECPHCAGPARLSIFCLVPRDHLELMRWLAVVVLILVVSGWRPRITGILHWWVSASLQVSAMTLDGGDQVCAVLTLLLLPVALTDARKWHWQSRKGMPPSSDLNRLIARSALVMIQIQVAGIYFHAAIAKFGVKEWANGTAIYYWLTDPTFGAPPWLRPALLPILTHGVVAAITWSVMLLEVCLFTALVMPPRPRAVLLGAGVCFHLAIAVLHGLPSFALAMMGALILYLRPFAQEFSLCWPCARFVLQWPGGIDAPLRLVRQNGLASRAAQNVPASVLESTGRDVA